MPLNKRDVRLTPPHRAPPPPLPRHHTPSIHEGGEKHNIRRNGQARHRDMGCANSAALDCCVPLPQWTVIVVGLDGAGKTSIVSHMKRTLTEGVFGPTNGVRLEELRAHRAKWQVRAPVKKDNGGEGSIGGLARSAYPRQSTITERAFHLVRIPGAVHDH